MVVGHLGIKYLILILLIFDIRNITHSSKQFRGGHSEYEYSSNKLFSLPPKHETLKRRPCESEHCMSGFRISVEVELGALRHVPNAL